METPCIGMGATYNIGSDSYACTIVEVSRRGRLIVTRDDKAVRADANGYYSESQAYLYVSNPNGELRRFTLRKDGSYRASGGSGFLAIGERHSYRDPSF